MLLALLLQVGVRVVQYSLYGDYDHLEDFCTISGNGLISVRDSLLFLVKFIEITTTLGLGQTRICCFKQFLQGWIYLSINETDHTVLNWLYKKSKISENMCILSLGVGVTAQKMGSVTFFCVIALPSGANARVS